MNVAKEAHMPHKRSVETVKTVSEELRCLFTGLKPGMNETTFEAKP
jgi:hypothetical protein